MRHPFRPPDLHLALAVFLALMLVGCARSRGPTSPTVSGLDPVGSYALVSAHGRRLPAVVSENPATGFAQEVVGGAVVLRGDRSFSWRTDYRQTDSGVVSAHASSGSGTYTTTGEELIFTFRPGGERLSGTLAGDVITIRADVELIYRR